MEDTWTLSELVEKVAQRIAALPPPKNGQVRAVPDERTVRYYGTLGLLDRPSATRGRTALYGSRHLAQVVAIKRLQALGRSLAEIQSLWSTLDDATLARMSGVPLASAETIAAPPRAARARFWSDALPTPTSTPTPTPTPASQHAASSAGPARPPAPVAPVELRVELAPGAVLALALPDDAITLSAADVRAIRAAAAPLIAELARRRLTTPAEEEEP